MYIDDHNHDNERHDNERDFWRDEPTSRLSRTPRTTERPRRHGDTPPRGLPRLQPAIPVAARQQQQAARLQLVPAERDAADPFDPYDPFDPFGSVADLEPAPMPSFRADRLITGEVPLTVIDGAVTAERPGRADPFFVRIGMMLAFGMIAIVLVWAVRGASADGPAPTPATTPTTAAAQVEVAPAQPGPSRRVSSAALPAARACSAGTYTVGRGDSWIAIAKKVGVTTKKLLKANGATAKTVIHPGRSICLPAGATAPTTSAAPSAAPSTKGTTTPKPPSTTAPEPSTTIVVTNYTAAEVEAIIRQVWPDELEDEALRIATRESNLKPSAKNSCCYGLFQIYFSVHKSWLKNVGVTSAGQLLDPTVNVNAAYALYQRAGGFGPWN
jgi:LysM repeat protein